MNEWRTPYEELLTTNGSFINVACCRTTAAAILMGIANWVGNGDSNANVFTIFLAAGGGAILNNLPLLFAVGLALGMPMIRMGQPLAGLVA